MMALFTACDMAEPKSAWDDGRAAVRVNITVDGVQGRTVKPNLALQDVTEWELWGGKQGDAETLLGEFSDSADAAFSLETATWGFTLKGFKEDDLILSGSIAAQGITAGVNTLAFVVSPILEGQGTLNITINLPAGSGVTQARVFVDGTELASPLTPANERVAFADAYDAGVYYVSIRLYKDDVLYRAVSEVIHVWANLQSKKTHTLALDDLNLTYVITYHLWDGETDYGYYQFTDATLTLSLPSRNGYMFKDWYDNAGFNGAASVSLPAGSTGNKDFYAKWTAITQAQGDSLADSLSWLATNADEGGFYSITMDASEAIAPTSLSYSGKTVNVILDGGDAERMVTLTATGALFTIESGVTFTLGNNVSLYGLDNNTTSLVVVNNGGTLVMNDGSKISGNTASAYAYSTYYSPPYYVYYYHYSYGGGVYVDSGGTFTMNGGAISGNTASPYAANSHPSASAYYYYYSNGGGVHVYGGTFTMNGGTISGNSASSNGYGGGVYMSSGTFTMNGGAINNNTTTGGNGGGGVCVNSGTFTMSGGAISGNTVVTANGGGVYNSGTFTMSSGTISENTGAYQGGGIYNSGTFTVSGGAISDNTASTTGGGVFNGGTFTVSGGAISGNTAANSGGGVYVDSGTFIKQSGGVVYGANADAGLKNTATAGGEYGNAVYVNTSPAKLRNSTAGAGGTMNSGVSGAAGGWETVSGVYNIAYTSVSGGEWILQSDGSRESPDIADDGLTKARVSFSSTADVSITILLKVASESGYDWAFISELDNTDATANSGYFAGSRISGNTSVTLTIPIASAGDHFIDIGYSKDGGNSVSSDCAWFTVTQ
jgi:uncharacterized repeat protein (TIGR02543 family)